MNSQAKSTACEGSNEPRLGNRRSASGRQLRQVVAGRLALALFGFFFVAASARAAGKPDDTTQDGDWLQTASSSPMPFSFVYGRQPSGTLMKSWPKKAQSRALDGNRTEHSVIWSDPTTQLEVRLGGVSYADSPVVEWTLHFKNNGTVDTPVLEEVEALDLSAPVVGSAIPTILYSRGVGGMDTYALRKQPLNQLAEFRMSNQGGGKTIDTIPFFDLRMQKQGIIGGLGWAGQWAISFSRPTEPAIEVRAGMEKTHLSLHPGEDIRTPLILLLRWSGDEVAAHNVLRRHVLKYYTPQYDGKPVTLPISHGVWGGMKTSTALNVLDTITKENLGYENFWMDAGWYGTDHPEAEFQVFGEEDWFLHAGNWRVNRIAHPDGLKPISDAVHAKGMKFLLWFEPERAVVGTPLTVEHPEWFIGEEGTHFEGDLKRPYVKFRLFNFGDPTARQSMTDLMSNLITKEGIDVYRQDCNFALSPFWDRADTGDRQGITQIRYVEGLLQFWDELQQRHPQLILDVVQRGDLDSIARAVDLSRADYPVFPAADPIANQLSTQGLAYWRAHFGTVLELRPHDNYDIRSGFAPGLSFALFNGAGTRDQVGKFIPPDFPFDWLRGEITLLKQARPYFYGDYYSILPCSSNIECETEVNKEQSADFEWAAWQFNRPEQGDGMVQAFRHPENDESAKNVLLRGLDPGAKYRISNPDGGAPANLSGKDLMEQGLRVEIPDEPGAVILFYQKTE